MDGYITLGDREVAMLYDALGITIAHVRAKGLTGVELDALRAKMFAGITPRTHGAEFRLLTDQPVDVCPDCGGSYAECQKHRAPEAPGYDECAPKFLLGDDGDEQPYEDADQRLGGNDA